MLSVYKGFLLLATLAPLIKPSDVAAQPRKNQPPFQQRISSRFSTPSAVPATAPGTPVTQAADAPTTVSIMQRQTYLDGRPPLQRVRNQVAWSVHLLPTLTWNSVRGSGTYARFDSPGASLQYSLGPSVDVYIRQRPYALSTGLWYTVKSVGFTHPVSDGGGLSMFRLHYLQLPLTMKLTSDNLIRAGRTYVQYGVTVDVKVDETVLDQTNNVLYQRDNARTWFNPVDAGLLLAVGYVRQISPTNSLIVSLQYQRGLTNSFRSSELVSRSNLLALGAGLSF